MTASARIQAARRTSHALVAAVLATLAACADKPVPPDWQGNAKSSLDSAVASWLAGDSKAESQDFARARAELTRTGRPDLVARAELFRCAAHVASLDFAPCAGFEALRVDADAGERAYADYLGAKPLTSAAIASLPVAQQPVAAAMSGNAVPLATVQAIADPLSQAIAVAVLFEAGHASPAMISLAADTASAQGWRRPLMAWLQVQAELADKAGDADAAERLRRRLALVRSR